MNPVLYPHAPLGGLFIHARGGLSNHLLFRCRERTGLGGETFDSGCVAVGRDQGGQRLNQMPGRAIYPRFVAGVNIEFWAASPALTTGNQFQFDHAFCTEEGCDLSIKVLRRKRHEHAGAALQRRCYLCLADNLREMR